MVAALGADRSARGDSRRRLSIHCGVFRSIQRDASSQPQPFLSEFSPRYAAMKMLLPNITSMSS